MISPRSRRRDRWITSSVRLRLLGGFTVLIVLGLAAATVVSGALLAHYLHRRSAQTLQANTIRVRHVLARGPQTANGAQLAALLGPPLGVAAVDADGHVLLSTGAATASAGELARITATTPADEFMTYRPTSGNTLLAIRLPSPGLIIDRGPGEGKVSPAALILCIDTSIDNNDVKTLIKEQAAVVGATLAVMLSLAAVVLRIGMKPLSRMSRTANAIAAGSLTQRLPIRGDRGETDQLAIAVNHAFDAQARAEARVRTFAADASHELRTPLSVISGWLDLHRQGGLEASALATALEHIDNEVGRMRLLVEELGLLARLDAGRPLERDQLDLTALAHSVVEDAHVVYSDRSITLTAEGPAPVLGDAARLQQVLRNLVGNAVQHTPAVSGVSVTINITPDTATVSVADDGPGISAEDLPRLFERFWRAEASRSRAHGGSGLGLAIVEAIVHAHDGHVSVHSTPTTGTTVTVTLPRPKTALTEPRDGWLAGDAVDRRWVRKRT